MVDLYEFDKSDYITVAGKHVVTIISAEDTDGLYLCTFQNEAGQTIKARYELSDKWGWKLLKLAKNAKLTEAQIMNFDPQYLIGKTVVIEVKVGDKYTNVWDTSEYDPNDIIPPASNSDVPF